MKKILVLLVVLAFAGISLANIWRANPNTNGSGSGSGNGITNLNSTGGGSVSVSNGIGTINFDATNSVDSVSLNHASNFLYTVTSSPQAIQEFSVASKGTSVGTSSNITINTTGDYYIGFTLSGALTNNAGTNNYTISAGVYTNGQVQTSIDATRTFSTNQNYGALAALNIMYNVSSGTVMYLEIYIPTTNGFSTSVGFVTTNIDFFAIQLSGAQGPQGIPGAMGAPGGVTNLDGTVQISTNYIEAPNVTGQVIAVSIPGIAAKGVLTNGFQQIIYASKYLTNNGAFNDATGWTNLLSQTMTNSKVVFTSGGNSLLTFDTNNMHGCILSGSNIEWDLNGQTISSTNIYTTAGSSLIDLRNCNGVYIHNGTFTLPAIATNNTVQQQTLFTMNGTNSNIHFENVTFNGGHWDFANGTELSNANYSFTFKNIIVNNAGCYGCSDGGFFDGTGRNLLLDGAVISNCFRFWENYNQSGGQGDPGNVKVINVSIKDAQHDGYVDTLGNGPHLDSLFIDNWMFETTLPSSTFPVYGSANTFVIQATRIADIRNVTVRTNGVFNTALIANVDSNLTVENYNGRGNSVDSLTAPNFSLANSTFGALTISANSTGSVQNVGSASLVNNGLVTFQRDQAGNTIQQGSLTVNSNAVFNAGMVWNSIILSQVGSLTINNTMASNILYLCDASAGSQSNILKTGAGRFPLNAVAEMVKTDATANVVTIDFGSGILNDANYSRYIILTNRGDNVCFQHTAISGLVQYHVWSGNIWSNLTAANINGTPTGNYVTNGGFVINVNGGSTQTVVNGGSITITPGSSSSTSGIWSNDPVDMVIGLSIPTSRTALVSHVTIMTNSAGLGLVFLPNASCGAKTGDVCIIKSVVSFPNNSAIMGASGAMWLDGVSIAGPPVGDTTTFYPLTSNQTVVVVFNGTNWNTVAGFGEVPGSVTTNNGSGIVTTFPVMGPGTNFINNTGSKVDIIAGSFAGVIATGPGCYLVFTNITTGESYSNGVSGAAENTQVTLPALDINNGDTIKFTTNYSGLGATMTWQQPIFKLKP